MSQTSSGRPKKQIKSHILGKKRIQNPTTSDPTFPPASPKSKRAKLSPTPPPQPQAQAPVTSNPRERTFPCSGRRNRFVQDGPVTLKCYRTSFARGGVGLRVIQNKKCLGSISAGSEIECKQLLVRSNYYNS